MRAVLVSQVIAVALLVTQPPLATLDGRFADVHEIPRFVLERVELPYGASGDCPQDGSRGLRVPRSALPARVGDAGQRGLLAPRLSRLALPCR